MRTRTKAVLCFLLLGLAGVAELRANSGFWLDVPFIKQQKNLCGAACISMVLQYWGRLEKREPAAPVPSQDEIAQVLLAKETTAIQGTAMQRYFEEHGFQAFIFKGEWRELEHHLSKGRPLIACLEANRKGAPGHYVVVAGIDSSQGLILINDPAQRKLLKMSRSNFEKSWQPTTHWTLLALPHSTSSSNLN